MDSSPTWLLCKARFLVVAAAVLVSGCGGSALHGQNAYSGSRSEALADRAEGIGTAGIAESFTSVTTPGTTSYKIGPLDVLDISVFQVADLSKNVQVTGSGSISLPLIGEVQASGRTAQELEHDIAARLRAKYLQNPQVTVYVKEYSSQRVTVEGAVKKPGVYPLKGKTSLLQIVATAEGLDPNSDSTVVVFRTSGSRRSAAKFDIGEVRSGKLDDPELQAGDVVVVGSSAMKETFNNLMKVLPLAGLFAVL